MQILTNIITIVSCITALGVILGAILKIHKWYLRQEEQNTEIAELRHQHEEDVNNIKAEDTLICFALSACLDGLEQLGCNHSVPKAKEKLDKYLNQQAHK